MEILKLEQLGEEIESHGAVSDNDVPGMAVRVRRVKENGVHVWLLGHDQGRQPAGLKGLSPVELRIPRIETLSDDQNLGEGHVSDVLADEILDHGLLVELHHPIVHQEKHARISFGSVTVRLRAGLSTQAPDQS